MGDAARKDEDGYFWVIGRVDDVINVSGHRLSTAEVESAIVSHPKVAESAVIGQADEDTGQSICAFVTLEGDLEGDDELIAEMREHVAQTDRQARAARSGSSGPTTCPRPARGKIMRRLLRDIAEGRELGDVTTLRDPDVMSQLEEKVKERRPKRPSASLALPGPLARPGRAPPRQAEVAGSSPARTIAWPLSCPRRRRDP